jgi:hypothetical protein
MAIINKGKSFANGEQLTADKLNQVIDNATFTISAVDNVSTQLSSGAIIVKDGGVTTAKLNNGAVTKAKIENVANMKVLGNTSGSAAAPQEVSILDEDDMSSDSATALSTQQSIKAYVTAMRPKFVNITGATLALSNTKSTTGSQTYTYNIADFTSDDVDFSTNKIVGLVIGAYATSSQSSNIVYADLPTGLETAIVRASADGTTDFDQSQTTTTIPINSGQTSIDMRLEVNSAEGIAAKFDLMVL